MISPNLRSLLCLFLVSVLCLHVANALTIDPNYSYKDFMRQFNRTYEGEQLVLHEQIFDEKYKQLLDRIAAGQDLKVNNFLDWNQTQLDAFFNYKPGKLGRPLSIMPLKSSLSVSPSSFDWRNAGRVTPIKDQQYCGACWSFASTGQYQSLLAMQTNGTIYDLSQQYAIQCQRTYSSGCNGGYPLGALQLFNSTGIPLETSYPYQPSSSSFYTSSGKALCNDPNRIKLTSTSIRIQHYSNLTMSQIQDQLISSGPLTVAVHANNAQFIGTGSSGLINNCPQGQPDHAVLLVGYNTTHWFIKNSWGTNWGHGGYGYVLKTNDCRLSSWVDVMQIGGNGTGGADKMTGYVEYNVTMTDSKQDGWNGNILAFKQDNVIVATFGSGFISGASYGPQTVRIKNNVQTQIVVYQKGNYTNEVGFTVKNTQGTIIYSRPAGTAFQANYIFKNFCPTSSCPVTTTVDYTAALVDAYGDGWNGVVLGFRQNGTAQNFGQDFTNGAQFNPKIYTFLKYKTVQVIVVNPGYWTQEIGFIVRNSQGYVVLQRNTGQAFDANAILGTFCPECVNLSPVNIVGDVEARQPEPTKETTTNYASADDLLKLQQSQQQNYSTIKSLMIATLALASCVLALLVAIAILSIKNYRLKKLPLISSQQDKTSALSSNRCGMISPSDDAINSANNINRDVEIYDKKFLKPVRVQYR